jgi:hypothetical protein
MSASEPPASEVSVTELDRAAKKKVKDLRYYYKNRERILAAQMVQRREDPEFQERQRVKEEAAAAAQAEKEARQAEKEARQAEKERQMAAKKEANSAINQEKRRLEQEEKMKQRQEAQRKRKEEKVKEKALALGLCLPPAESFSGDPASQSRV